MRRLSLVLACASALSASAAVAADLGMPVKAPPPPAEAPAPSWTGLYLGLNFGYDWTHTTNTVLAPAGTSFPVGFSTSREETGVIGGVQGGFNYQINQFVLGVEGDWDVADVSGSDLAISTVDGNTSSSNGNVRWQADITGRAGVLVWNGLLYVKGGGAWQRDETSTTQISTTGGIVTESQIGVTRSGWLIGGGYEWLWGNVSAKIEYDHMDFGSATINPIITTSSPTAAAGGFPVGTVLNRGSTTTSDVVKVGFNYHFNFFR